MKSHKDIKFTDKIWWTIQVHNIINKNREQTIESVQLEQKCYQLIEDWLREGKYTIIDVLKD